MKMTREKESADTKRWRDWHILTVAETGFSKLDIYGRLMNGLGIDVIRRFAEQVNTRDEAGSLHPVAPISAMSRRFFREQESDTSPDVLNDFRRQIAEFIEANDTAIHAERILVDLHVSPKPIPTRYIDAVEEVFGANGKTSIQEVVVLV